MMDGRVGGRRWGWFLAWSLPGACFGLSVSAVGLFTLPLGILIVLALVRRSGGREMLGLLAGVGAIAAFIGSIHLDYQACSTDHLSLTLRVGQTSVASSCGGVDGVPWLIAGIAVIVAAVVLYWRATRRSSPGTSANAAPTLG